MEIKQRLKRLQYTKNLIETLQKIKTNLDPLNNIKSIAQFQVFINNLIEEIIKEKKEIIKLIFYIDDNLTRTIFLKKYILGKLWKELAIELNITEQRLREILNEGIKIIEARSQENEK